MIRPSPSFAIALLLCAGCFGSSQSGAPSVHDGGTRATADAAARPVGRPLAAEHLSYTGRIGGGIGSYSAQTTVSDAQRSLANGARGRLIAIPGIGSVSVSCSLDPVARFDLTTWAQGEGPPKVTQTVAHTHGQTSLAGLAGRYTVPMSETRHQDSYQWEISDGGGEAFQFSGTVTALLTPTTTRCDLLAEAAVVTTGAFYRYAR